MPIDDEDLDIRPVRKPMPRYESEDGRGGNRLAGILGACILIALLGGGGFLLYRVFSTLPEDPGPQKSDVLRPKNRPADQTEFVINAPAYSKDRYAGPLDTYVLIGIDKARQLAGLINNQQAAAMDIALEGDRKAAKKPGPGCTVKDVQNYYLARNIEFLELPPSLVWGYDPKKGEVYLGMRP